MEGRKSYVSDKKSVFAYFNNVHIIAFETNLM